MAYKSFGEYWAVAKSMSADDRRDYFQKHSKEEQRAIIHDYHEGGWQDLFVTNQIDAIADSFRRRFGVDLFEIRAQACVRGETVLVDCVVWGAIVEMFAEYQGVYDLSRLFGGLGWRRSTDGVHYEVYPRETHGEKS